MFFIHFLKFAVSSPHLLQAHTAAHRRKDAPFFFSLLPHPSLSVHLHVRAFSLPALRESERSADSAQFVNKSERHERVSVGLPRAFAVREMPSTCTTRPRLMKPSPINNSSQLLPDRSPACPYGRLAWGRESKTDRNQMEAERSAGEGRRNSHTNRLYV